MTNDSVVRVQHKPGQTFPRVQHLPVAGRNLIPHSEQRGKKI
ncbi:hypothetical protein ACWF76_05270 [Streptomyces globisporus]|nr:MULTISPECIES: hypothetical protein [Streptomyces]